MPILEWALMVLLLVEGLLLARDYLICRRKYFRLRELLKQGLHYVYHPDSPEDAVVDWIDDTEQFLEN